MSDAAHARVQSHLARSRLPQMAGCVDGLAQEAAQHDRTYLELLERLMGTEVSARYARDVATKTKLAHVPFVKTPRHAAGNRRPVSPSSPAQTVRATAQ